MDANMKLEQLPMLVVYDLQEGAGIEFVVADHPVFAHVTGFHTNSNLSFYTNDMHTKVLDEIGNKVLIYGNNINSAENKVNTMLKLFAGDCPSEGQQFRATILINLSI